MSEKTRHCLECGASFEASNAKHRYCSVYCSNLNGQKRSGQAPLWERGRFCRICGKQFFPKRGAAANNRWHCSDDCSRKSARNSRSKFWKSRRDPRKTRARYYRASRKKLGPDTSLKRFYRNNPRAPKKCEACGESRILDVAHRPEHARRGAWRSSANRVWPEKVWVLCPTCHGLLDRMHYSPKDLGLS